MDWWQVVSEKFYHYDTDGNGYLDEKEVAKVAEDLHKAFHPGAGGRGNVGGGCARCEEGWGGGGSEE